MPPNTSKITTIGQLNSQRYESIEENSTHIKLAACVACGSPDYDSTGPEAPGFIEFAGDKRFNQLPYSIRECVDCGLLYRSCALADNDIDEFYQQIDFRKWRIDGLYPTERAALKELKKVSTGGRILDFGCSTGRLLSQLTATHECYGSELNSDAVAQAAAKGLKILSTEQLGCGANKNFDAVVLIDVFEHFKQPLRVLRTLFSVVRDGGILLIVTGNGDSKVCRVDPAQFWYFRSVQHVSMLTRRHVLFLLRELGGTFECWQELTHYDTAALEKVWQWGRYVSYWQFRNNTFFARRILSWVPLLRRARHWKSEPALTCTRDHVMVVLRKNSNRMTTS